MTGRSVRIEVFVVLTWATPPHHCIHAERPRVALALTCPTGVGCVLDANGDTALFSYRRDKVENTYKSEIFRIRRLVVLHQASTIATHESKHE